MSDRSAILDLLGRVADAWNAGDAAAYADLFTEDADYVTFFGQNMPGRAAIEEAHRRLFEGPLRGSRLTGLDRPEGHRIRFVRLDVAIVVTGGGSSLDGGDTSDPDRQSTLMFVAVRDDGRWRFAAFQNTRRSAVPSVPAGPGGEER